MSKRVRFPGHGEFWLLEGGALAQPEHCDEQGEIKDFRVALFGDSYAHLFPDGVICRYKQVIGRREDLVDIDAFTEQ